MSGQSHAEPKVWVVMTSALAALPLAFCHSFEFPETSSVGESVQTTGVMQHLPPTYPVPGWMPTVSLELCQVKPQGLLDQHDAVTSPGASVGAACGPSLFTNYFQPV